MIDNLDEGLDLDLDRLVLQGLVLDLDHLIDDPGLDPYLVALIVMITSKGEETPPEVSVAVIVVVAREVTVDQEVIIGREVAAVRVAMNVETQIGGEVVQDRFLGGAVGVENAIS